MTALPIVVVDSDPQRVSALPTTQTLSLNAGTTANAPLNVPEGVAPTSPADGDVWTTSAGLFARIGGVTVGPFGAARASGTAFPGSPASGDIFYRTDRNIEYAYDGTRWLSTTLYSASIAHNVSLSGAAGTNLSRWSNQFWNKYDIYIEDVVTTMMNSAATPASNYTTAELRQFDGATQTTLVSGISSQNNAQNAYVTTRTAYNTVLLKSVEILTAAFTRVASGAGEVFMGITFRLVG
jgi:hypothetical protein